MLIRELIARHIGPEGALHERGIRLSLTQLPSGVRTHHSGEDADLPVAGDLLVISAPAGPGLREHLDSDLPVGATVILLLGLEVAELPVGRVLAALSVAKLQVVEAAVVSGTASPTVAVAATRTDELVAPQPYLAHDLEPGDHESPAVLRRILGEHTLEGLVLRARERALMAQVGEAEAGLREVTMELEDLRGDQQEHVILKGEHKALVGEHKVLVGAHKTLAAERKAMRRDLETARRETDTERKRIWSLERDLENARREADSARREADSESKRMRALRSSTSFKVASRLARMSGVARRITRQPHSRKARQP